MFLKKNSFEKQTISTLLQYFNFLLSQFFRMLKRYIFRIFFEDFILGLSPTQTFNTSLNP